MALDADIEVVGVAAQPMWLRWTAESGRSVRLAPDYFARRAAVHPARRHGTLSARGTVPPSHPWHL